MLVSLTVATKVARLIMGVIRVLKAIATIRVVTGAQVKTIRKRATGIGRRLRAINELTELIRDPCYFIQECQSTGKRGLYGASALSAC